MVLRTNAIRFKKTEKRFLSTRKMSFPNPLGSGNCPTSWPWELDFALWWAYTGVASIPCKLTEDTSVSRQSSTWT